MNSVLAFGNPLIDWVVRIESPELLRKFHLEEDGAKEISQAQMMEVMREIQARKADANLFPGGSALNTMRILQWLQQGGKSTVMYGAIGSDANATLLQNMVEAAGVQAKFSQIENGTTGWVISIVYQSNRMLLANIGVAEMYRKAHFDCLRNHDLMRDCEVVYMEGFFITKRSEVSRYIVGQARMNRKTFMFNLSGEYLMDLQPADMIYFAKHANILIGNRNEFDKLANVCQLTADQLAKQLTEADKEKMIVITNADKPIYYYKSKEVKTFNVPEMRREDIVDTTGSGDAFASGFLYGYLRHEPDAKCIKFGTWTAQRIITQLGCMPPSEVSPSMIHAIC